MRIILVRILATIGFIALIVVAQDVIWPFLVPSDVVTEGGYREIDIGATKSDIALIITGAHGRRSKLRMSGYMDTNDIYKPIIVSECTGTILDSDVWYLSYPGIFNERIKVIFEDDRVATISYSRSPFDS